LPNYLNNWRRLGFGEEDFADAWSDRLVDAITAWGDEQAIKNRASASRRGGTTPASRCRWSPATRWTSGVAFARAALTSGERSRFRPIEPTVDSHGLTRPFAERLQDTSRWTDGRR
jgi:hypothetical protein